MNKARLVIPLITVLFSLSACSTYSSKFVCSDSMGMPCTMMRSIDKKLDSGEIEKAYFTNCNSRKCKKAEQIAADRAINIKSVPYEVELVREVNTDEMNFVSNKDDSNR